MITASESAENIRPLPDAQSVIKQRQHAEEAISKPIPLAPMMGSFMHSENGTTSIPSHQDMPSPPKQEADTNDQGTDEETGVIRCICLCDDDDGFTIQCDRCLVWQHCACFGMSHSSVPDEYLCEQCDPRPVDSNYARAVQRRRLQEEARKTHRAKHTTSSAASTLFESAANAAWESAVHGTKVPVPRKKRQSSRSPQTRPVPDHETVDDLDLNATSSSRSKPRNKRSRSHTRKSVAGPSPSKGSDDEEIPMKFESWQIEFTNIDSNHIREPNILQVIATHLFHWTGRSPLKATPDESGFFVAPLRCSTVLPPHEQQRKLLPSGLAAVGFETIPVEIHCKSLTELSTHPLVRTISDQVTGSFFNNISHLQPLPSEPQNVWSASKAFCRPSMHGLFSDTYIPAGAFIMEYLGELYSADTYRSNPINQYAQMGTTKPHVHLFPQPLNMVVDARMYGNSARFARSSCHPNAVLRSIFHYDGSSDIPRLSFGIFAISAIPKSQEITLGWEWDDHHIVHILPSLARRPWAMDDATRLRKSLSPKEEMMLAAEEFSARGDFPYGSTILARKFNAILSIILSYTTCGCVGPSLGGSSTNSLHTRRQNCAVTQMLRASQGMPLLYTSPSPRNPRMKPIAFEPLVGVFRHWVPDLNMDPTTHLCAKISQNECFVQRVPYSDEPPNAWDSLHNKPESEHESDTESESGASTATEIVSEDYPYASENEDALVKEALRHLEQQSRSILPLKKRADRIRTKDKMSGNDSRRISNLASRSDTISRPNDQKNRSPSKVTPASQSGLKRQKRHLDKVDFSSSDEEGAPVSPSRHIRKKSMQSLAGKHTLKREHSDLTGPPQVRPVASPSPQLGPVRPTSPTQSRSGSVTPPLLSSSASKRPSVDSQTAATPAVSVAASSPLETNTSIQRRESSVMSGNSSLPPAPPKRLSLAEYKKRLSSRRKPENQVQSEAADTPTAPSKIVSFDSQREKPVQNDGALDLPIHDPISLQAAPSSPVSSSLPSMERSGIRSVIIPRSPPQGTAYLPSTTNLNEVSSGAVLDPLSKSSELNSGTMSRAPTLPVASSSSLLSNLEKDSVPTKGGSSLVQSSLPRSLPVESPSARLHASPPLISSLQTHAPPPGPPPGPPPPMPPRLRAAQNRVDERNRQAHTNSSAQSTTPDAHDLRALQASRHGTGSNCSSWRPVH